ncbi:ABC transporter ATP-binding protein [Neobacillus sp. SM06]|uniref:ABC transporter ATP-binding protein n=1 Tax=Neobacillus sp. SM06 TaxID=3422492 RepID=UPI003D2DB552
MIHVKDLSKVYDNGFKAVSNLSLHVKSGDIYGFLGPNGAGKTTTIRMLNGLIKPTGGEVTIEGTLVKQDEPSVKRKIGVLPESHGYYNWMTGYEYLTFFAELYDVPKEIRTERVINVLEMVGMSEKKNIRIGQYSRGMRQRIGIAKTIVHQPSLIFLDEPTLGLDPQGQKDIQKIILDLNQKQGVTVFITSHLLKEIAEICNRVAIVKKGRLLEEGEISQLLHKYERKIQSPDSSQPVTLEDVFFYVTKEGEQ